VPGGRRRALQFAGASILAISLISRPMVASRVDPQTGRVRVFNIGTSRMVRTMGLDPLLTVTAFPQSMTWENWERDAIALKRYQRIYFPRTYGQILDSFDVIYSAGSAGPVGYQPAWTRWFRDSVVNEGLGLCETGGAGSFGGQKQFPGWIGTEVEEIMPVELIHSPGEEPAGAILPKVVTLQILVPDDPFIASLPMNTIPRPAFMWINQGGIKQGATTVIVRKEFPDWPVYAHLDVGEGRAVGWLPFVYTIGGYYGNFAYWEYFADFLINFQYFAAHIDMPDDPVQTHQVRVLLQEFDAKRQFLIDIIEFASRFGASTAALESLIEESEEYERRIRELYIEHRYEETFEAARQSREDLEKLQLRAMKMKANALLWVYTIEWLAVTGTAVISGSLLWALMVRRKVYREVGATRLSSA